MVHSRKPDNVARLLEALKALEASCPVREGTVMTRFGPLDLLGMIGRGQQYEDLRAHTVVMQVGRGVKVRVLDLPTLIQIKQELGGK